MDWALNKTKLTRAMTNAGPNATEEQVKAEYVKLGGLLIQGVDSPIIEQINIVLEEPTDVEIVDHGVVEEAPKKVKRTTKKK